MIARKSENARTRGREDPGPAPTGRAPLPRSPMASPPDTRHPTPGGPLWADGSFTLRVRGAGEDRSVEVRRPFALVGRLPGVDLRIEDAAVSARHAYLHLDRRGVYGVDLSTRTGSRFGPDRGASGWLRPGLAFEVAGRRIELVEVRLAGDGLDPGPAPADPLADTPGAPLTGVTLHAIHARHTPRALGSEMVFVGRGASCGVRVEGATASRVHCVVVRTESAAFLVDLIGRGTWLNGRPVPGAAILADGDTLAVGSAQFGVRVKPPGTLPARSPTDPTREAFPSAQGLPPLPGSIPAEAQGAVLAWMMGALQAGQAEALRRQGEFQLALTRLIQQMQRDNAALLTEHLDRMERIDRELAGLRAEIARRFGSAEAASVQARAVVGLPAEIPVELRVAPAPRPLESDPAAAAWLIGRVGELEEEQRSTWKDMVARLTGRSSRPS